MKFPKVPNNSLTSAINELIRLCKLKEDDLLDNTFFDESLCEEIITSWEKENNITVPVTYKEWLFFSGYCQIDQNLAEFYSPDMFIVLTEKEQVYVQIGKLIGDGEMLCFKADDGLFFRILDGHISKPIIDFREVLEEVNRMLSNNSGISNETIQKLLRKIKENI